MFVVDNFFLLFFNYRLQHGTLLQVHKLCHFLFLYLLFSINSKRTNAQIDMQLLQIWTALWPRIHMYKWLRATGTGGETETGSCVGVRLSVAPCLSEGKHSNWFS